MLHYNKQRKPLIFQTNFGPIKKPELFRIKFCKEAKKRANKKACFSRVISDLVVKSSQNFFKKNFHQGLSNIKKKHLRESLLMK